MLFLRTAETDDLVALTVLIRAAYAPHALKGLRYWATHQSVEDTARRLSRGVGFVGEVVGPAKPVTRCFKTKFWIFPMSRSFAFQSNWW